MPQQAYQELSQELARLETELKNRGWWTEHPPSAEALASQEPFCCDRMALENWLQWVFIPRMHLILKENRPLPENCAIAPMAEYMWKDRAENALELVRILARLDDLISN